MNSHNCDSNIVNMIARSITKNFITITILVKLVIMIVTTIETAKH